MECERPTYADVLRRPPTEQAKTSDDQKTMTSNKESETQATNKQDGSETKANCADCEAQPDEDLEIDEENVETEVQAKTEYQERETRDTAEPDESNTRPTEEREENETPPSDVNGGSET